MYRGYPSTPLRVSLVRLHLEEEGGGGRLVVIGGDDSQDYLADVWAYSPVHNTWAQIKVCVGLGGVAGGAENHRLPSTFSLLRSMSACTVLVLRAVASPVVRRMRRPSWLAASSR